MKGFYIYWCYSTFYMLTFSYRAYMGFIDYLCTYTPKREEIKREHKQQEKKNTSKRGKKREQKKEA